MIRTGQKRVPWHWIVLLCFTTGVYGITEAALNGAPMAKLLARFTEDPFYLSLVAVLAPLLAMTVAPYVSWKSDRIWTRFGRRKPFMIAGWALVAVMAFAAPFVPNLWILLLIIVLWHCGTDVGYTGPFSPLFYEVVPSSQRGRGAAIKRGMNTALGLFSGWVLLSQWDHVYGVVTVPAWLPGPPTLQVTGSHVMFVVLGVFSLVCMVNVAVNVRESQPVDPLPAETFNPLKFMTNLFSDRQWLMIYLLLFCSVALSAGLGGYLNTQLVTKQFGYDMRTMARYINTPNQLLSLVVIAPVAFLLADRFNRQLLFRVGLWLSTLHALGTWGVIQLVGVPPIWMWVLIVFLGHLVDQVAAIALEPLIFDLIPADKMGTANSGFVIVARVLSMIIIPCVGGFARYMSFWRFGKDSGQWDYSAGFLVIFALGVIACGVYAFFESQVRQGKISEYGSKPVDEPDPALPTEPAADDVSRLPEETAAR